MVLVEIGEFVEYIDGLGHVFGEFESDAADLLLLGGVAVFEVVVAQGDLDVLLGAGEQDAPGDYKGGCEAKEHEQSLSEGPG